MFPCISVVVSAYNSEKYIGYTIKSILKQSFRDFELLIVDDASTDETYKIISSFTDSRIKIFRNDKNVGLTKNINFCIQKAKGKYIARIDSDDICTIDRLAIQYAFMESNPNIDVVGSDAYLINESGKILGVTKEVYTDRDIKQKSIFMNPMIHPTIMVRSNLIKDYMYDEQFRVCQDYDLWVRMIPNCEFRNLDKPLIYYRLNKDGSTRRARNDINKRINLLVPIIKRAASNMNIEIDVENAKQMISLVLNYHDEKLNNNIINYYKSCDRNAIGDKLDMSLVRFYKGKLIKYGLSRELFSGVKLWISYLLKQVLLYLKYKSVQNEINSLIID